MERKTKNIIMIIIILGLCITSFFVMKNVNRSNNNSQQGNMQNMSGGPSMGTPPSMPGDNNSNDNQTSNTNENQTTIENSSNSEEQFQDNQNTPPEKPDGESSSDSNGTPPSMPGGTSNGNGGTPPSKPGESSNENMMGMNNSSSNSIDTKYYVIFGGIGFGVSLLIIYLLMSGLNKKTVKETFTNGEKVIIYLLSIIILTSGLTFGQSYITNNILNEKIDSTSQNNNGPGGSTSSATYKSAKEITSDDEITSGEYESTSSDENTISASGSITATISDVTVSKTGDSDGGDNTSFYGTNSAIIAKDGANLTLKNITVTTDATGANGVFSYGGSATTNNSNSDGTTVTISDSKITTTKDNSGGIMTTGGGTMIANNLEVNTSGTSSAAIRSDRGGGTVTVNKGTYKTTGQGSPTIYSTANIKVSDATLEATASEGVVIEGANSVTLDNVKLTDTNNKLNGKSTTYKNIFLYQSMSGDASSGTASFSAKDSTITTNKGDTLYVTNTTATITLENNEIINNDSTGNFLRAQKDSWGNNGSNGGAVTLKLINQDAVGNIVIDSISTLDLSLTENSYYEGTINGDNSAKSIKLSLDKNSKIKLTGDSYVTSLEDDDSSYSNIDFNGYKLYVNGKAIN